MAAKKQQNKVNSDKTARTTGSRKSAGTGAKNAANSRKKAGRARQVQEPEPLPEEEGLVRAEVIVLGSFAAAVLLFLSNFHLCGFAGDFLRSIQLGLFGLPGYIAPLVLFVGTCFYQANRGNRVALHKNAASAAAFFLLCGFSQMIFGQQPEAGKGILEYYRLSAASGMGGGLAGGLLFGVLRSVLGSIGAFLILAVGMILCMVCITGRSFVKAVKHHSDAAYQYAREDMERRREIHAERQEERRKLREEQRVRGVNLGSTYLPAKEDEYLEEDPEADYGERYEDDYDNGYDDGSADNHDSGYHDNYADGHAEHYDDSYDYGDSDSGSYGESYGTRGRAEHAASRPRPKRQTPDQADVFTGSISMPDEYRDEKPDVPAYSTNLPAGEVVPPEPEDDYDLEAAARKLTESGFGRFEEAGEVFTGGARKLDGPVKTDRAEKADTYEDVAPWDEPDTYTENPYTENSYTADPYAQQQAEMRNGQNMQQEQTKAVQAASAEKATLNRVQKPAQGTGQELQTESAQQMWETVQEPQPEPVQRMQEPSPYMPEPAPEEYLPEPDVAYTVKTEQNTDFAIPEESKHVVTAGGKVIETDTEALQKKLESTKKAEAAKREAEQADSEAALQQKIQEKEEQPKKPYIYPPLSLLKRGSRNPGGYSEQEYRETAVKLQQTLRNFGVGVTVTNISCGPSVTRYELHPEQGVKVSKIVGLADDIKLSLAAEDIRIEAPIPGKSAVGIEVPNKEKTSVFLRDLLESDTFQKHPSRLAFAVGKDIGGQVVVTDIAKMPHLLIAGATGSGKSVCINTIIMSIIYKADPEDVKLIMVDPKVVELSVYNGIPHLLIPVVTDPKKASGALNWAVAEMTDRYKKFAKYGVRDLKGYNAKIETIQDIDDADKPKKMPQIVIVVDELADLMMVAPGEVEDAICRLAQLARAAGIHLVIATQRPSVNVITGLIKANVPSRIAFSVSSGVDSRTIIDMNGAEKLLGKGDMLFYPAGFPKPQRVQGAFVSDSEVQQVVDFLTEQGLTAQYSPEVENSMNAAPSATSSGTSNSRDEYFEQAGRFIIEKEKASIGMLQRMFKIGFNRAARIMDQLAEAGVVGEEEGTKPRKVLMTMEEFDQII